MRTRHLVYIALILILVAMCSKNDAISNDNIYLIHLNDGTNIKCNYHNSRDIGKKHKCIVYYDFYSKERKGVKFNRIDSITVIQENFWTCGPRHPNIKYIEICCN